MKKGSIIITTTVVAVFLFLLFPTCSFASEVVEPLAKAERPVWNIGDTWVYKTSRDGQNYEEKFTVTAVTDEGYITTNDKEGKKTFFFYNRDLNFLKWTDESGNTLEGAGSGQPMFRWPLKIGDSWSGSYLAHGYSGNANLMTLDVEVAGAETIVAADGKEVPTLKLIYKRKNIKGNFLAKREYWYAPKMGYIIKRVDERLSAIDGKREIRELISFTAGGTK